MTGVLGAEKLNLNCFGDNCVCLSNFSRVSYYDSHVRLMLSEFFFFSSLLLWVHISG